MNSGLAAASSRKRRHSGHSAQVTSQGTVRIMWLLYLSLWHNRDYFFSKWQEAGISRKTFPKASHPAVCSWGRGAAETRSWLGFIAPPQSQQWKHFYSLLSLQALLQRNPLPLEGFKVSIRGLVRKPLCVFFLDLVCLISVENLFISSEASVPQV